MKDQTTTIEQSCRLLELGVPAKAASMCWVKDPNEGEYSLCLHDEFCYEVAALEPVPAFTVADLQEMLPDKISCESEFDGRFRIWRYAGDERIYWIIDYDVFVFTDTNLIDALIQTIEWLLTNEHGLWI